MIYAVLYGVTNCCKV